MLLRSLLLCIAEKDLITCIDELVRQIVDLLLLDLDRSDPIGDRDVCPVLQGLHLLSEIVIALSKLSLIRAVLFLYGPVDALDLLLKLRALHIGVVLAVGLVLCRNLIRNLRIEICLFAPYAVKLLLELPDPVFPASLTAE